MLKKLDGICVTAQIINPLIWKAGMDEEMSKARHLLAFCFFALLASLIIW
jgi:hypothetical protein